ncbi:MAG: thiamine phosphate synthase [Acidobacteriota bacterium]|nr:thiamine phosphate synthase [Blastocatellia bacterium]MDW8238622.1 thiamine phosphate synthase [Acidobacteriota bacterium]
MMPRVYAITDRVLTGLSHAEQVRQLAAGGISWIQLREKAASPRAFYQAAEEAMRVARDHGVTLLVNDRVDIALAVDADGVHLGQDDVPVQKARAVIKPGKIIGLSTHSLEQALAADALPVDYIAIGPVFATTTKPDHEPVVGLETIRRVRQRISKPLVAIGGITLETAPQVIAAGADAVAVISDLLTSGSITERARAFCRVLEAVERADIK